MNKKADTERMQGPRERNSSSRSTEMRIQSPPSTDSGTLKAPPGGVLQKKPFVLAPAALFLAFIYTAPIFLLTYGVIETSGFETDSEAVQFFYILISNPDSALTYLYHFLPLIFGVMSTAAFRKEANIWFWILAVFLVLSLCVTIGLFTYLNFDQPMTNLKMTYEKLAPKVQPYLGGLQGTLLTYIALLFGVKRTRKQ